VKKFIVQKKSLIISIFIFASILLNSKNANSINPPDKEKPAISSCDVIINGGSLAAYAAAISSSDNGVSTCLIEPTSWLGGQLTNQGVSAIDFPYQQLPGVNVANISKQSQHIPMSFRYILSTLRNQNVKCWVSSYCSNPDQTQNQILQPEVQKRKNLKVYYNSVIKNVKKENRLIKQVDILQRPADTQDKTFSEQVHNWYDNVVGNNLIPLRINQGGMFIEASELGDLLVLSGASYIQGQELPTSNSTILQTCGQAISYPFSVEMISKPLKTSTPEHTTQPHSLDINKSRFSWERIWSYRRVKGDGPFDSIIDGEVSIQNWESGNDYKDGYVFLSKDQTNNQIADWHGGLNTDTLTKAENHSFSWLRWFIDNSPIKYRNRVKLDTKTLGTTHGLSKIPYFRDSRRSVGPDNYILTQSEITPQNGSKKGTKFNDRISIGAYPIDIHTLANCNYPPNTTNVYPYYIPYRSLMNKDFDNLLVAGKNIAQDFAVASSTRVHTTEYSTGVAAGVIASHLKLNKLTTYQGQQQIQVLQDKVSPLAPIEWNF
jgi:hypothetical protein